MSIRRLLPLCLPLAIGCAERPPVRPTARAEDAALSVPGLRALVRARGPEALAAEAELAVARGQKARALSLRVASAAFRHDVPGMVSLAGDPALAALRADAESRAWLGDVLATSLGLAAGRADLAAACGAAPGALSDETRAEACSRAAVAKAAEGTATRLGGARSATAPWFPKVPIPIVMMSLEGRPAEPFVVDTGAAGLALSKAYCDRVGIPYLSEARTTTDASGQGVRIQPVLVRRMSLGDLQVNDLEGVVIEFPPQLKVAGIVAPQQVFRGALVEIDGRANRLVVDRDRDLAAWKAEVAEPVQSTELVWEGGNVYVRANLDGKLSGFWNFDTGAAGSVIALSALERLGRTVERSAAEESLSIHRHASFPPFDGALAVGEGPAVGTPIVPIERRPDAQAMLDRVGNVGQSWMRGRRMALSPDGRTLAFTGATGPAEK